MQNWQRRADEGEPEYVKLLAEVEPAEHELLAKVAGNAAKLTEKDIRGALDFLGRRDPQDWGRTDQLNVGVTVDAGPVFKALAEAQHKMVEGAYEILDE